jgi:L-iditol 2-dehydrogenase
MRFCSSAKTHPHLDGTLREKMNHPASLLFK